MDFALYSPSDYDETHEDEYKPNHHPLLLKLDGRAIGTARLDDFGNGNDVTEPSFQMTKVL
jgi:hypothetical protein